MEIRNPGQAPFRSGFVFWSLWIALLAGFSVGAHVAWVVGFDFPLSPGFYAFIQVHGHLQIIGWVGLFIMGVSLHFIPRLTHQPLAYPGLPGPILFFMVSGLLLRLFCQCFLPYLENLWLLKLAQVGLLVSGTFELLGIFLYVFLLAKTALRVPKENLSEKLVVARPFLGMMLFAWLFYATLNLWLVFEMTQNGTAVVSQHWNLLGVRVFLNLGILPVTFAFSFLTFPLFLRLPLPRPVVLPVAILFGLGVLCEIAPPLFANGTASDQTLFLFSRTGRVLKGICLLWWIWEMDIITRRRKPWTVLRDQHPGPDRRPTRPGLPDYGEFGCFEWAIYAAYTWLAFGAVLEITMGVLTIAGFSPEIGDDAVRHTYLLGFATILIFGMAPRMLPGFWGKSKVAVPGLVKTTFWLANAAAFGRVFPFLLPASLADSLPILTRMFQYTFGVSGVLGMAAILCLLINLKKTAKS